MHGYKRESMKVVTTYGGNMNQKNKTAERLLHASAGANLTKRRYYRPYVRSSQEHFRRLQLPSPADVLHRLGLKALKANTQGYLKLHCPFHKNGKELRPSLNLHQTTGHFRCHACGAKGGDILAFYMNVTGKSFINAAKELGAWGENI